MSNTQPVVVLCTVPNAEVGAALAHQLVGRKFAAAVAIVPGVRSVYRWRGAIHDRQELQLVVKTVRGRIADVRQCIATQHPYEVAECMALEVVDASPSYLEWLQVQTTPEFPEKSHS